MIEALWQVINELYLLATGEELKREPDYTGKDIDELRRFYMTHVVPGRR